MVALGAGMDSNRAIVGAIEAGVVGSRGSAFVATGLLATTISGTWRSYRQGLPWSDAAVPEVWYGRRTYSTSPCLPA